MPSKDYEILATDENDETRQEKSSHPMSSANLLSRLTFYWMNGIFKIGNKRSLDQSDFLPLHDDDRTRHLTEQLQKEWNNHVQECNSTADKQPELWKCVLRTISLKEILYLLSYWFAESICRVSQPLVLGLLLRLLSSTEMNRTLTYACCLLLALAGLSTACRHYSGYRFDLLGMRLSSALRGIIYLKARVLITVINSNNQKITFNSLQRTVFFISNLQR